MVVIHHYIVFVMNDSVFQQTKDTLGTVISKPPLTDKLLGRPPFRYLHDIISSVLKSSGFFKDLYSSQELDAKNIQDKDAKVDFLQKAIDVLSFTMDEVINVKALKIVAGQEPEKTNEFLQLLGLAIMKKMDSAIGVKRVLNGEKPGGQPAKGKGKKRSEKRKDSDKESPLDKDRPGTVRSSRPTESAKGVKPSRSKEKAGLDVVKSSSKGKVKLAGSTTSIKSSHSKGEVEKLVKVGEERKRSEHSLKPTSSKTRVPESESGDDVSKSRHKMHSKRSVEIGADLSEGVNEGLGSDSKFDRPPSAKGDRKQSYRASKEFQKEEAKLSEHVSLATDEPLSGMAEDVLLPLIPHEKRPGTVRLAPPKVVRREDVPDDLTAREPASHLGEVPATVIMDAADDDEDNAFDDDDSQFLVKDSTKLPPTSEQVFANEGAALQEKPEGALTKNIVAMKEHLEGDLEKESSQVHVYPAITEAQRRKERELVSAEIEKLQSSIQVLCKSANPLGKIMDYVQEDVESMQKELEMWQAENVKHMESLQREESITEQELHPLQALLEELDAKIKEQKDMIGATKSNILRNDAKTQQLVHTLTFGSS